MSNRFIAILFFVRVPERENAVTRVFILGASGYIGGSVAVKLTQHGYSVRGLTRDAAKAPALAALGIQPVVGDLKNFELIKNESRQADIIINAAQADIPETVETILQSIQDQGKVFIHTSGASVVADKAYGDPSEKIYRDDMPFQPIEERRARAELDRRILRGVEWNIKTSVICPALIYGTGKGIHQQSIQLPLIIKQARETGIPRYVGRGLNIWSNVHIDDVADLYLRTVQRAPHGVFFFAENGEASFKDMADGIQRCLKTAPAQGFTRDEAAAAWGEHIATFIMSSNARVRGFNARKILGWAPRHHDIFDGVT